MVAIIMKMNNIVFVDINTEEMMYELKRIFHFFNSFAFIFTEL